MGCWIRIDRLAIGVSAAFGFGVPVWDFVRSDVSLRAAKNGKRNSQSPAGRRFSRGCGSRPRAGGPRCGPDRSGRCADGAWGTSWPLTQMRSSRCCRGRGSRRDRRGFHFGGGVSGVVREVAAPVHEEPSSMAPQIARVPLRARRPARRRGLAAQPRGQRLSSGTAMLSHQTPPDSRRQASTSRSTARFQGFRRGCAERGVDGFGRGAA